MRATALFSVLILFAGLSAFPQETVVVRPQEIDDVLNNPHMGFMTFQRFNGDELNQGKSWTEGYPIQYQEFDGNLENPDHPATTIAYFRVYWKFLEPEQDKYRWDLIDQALRTAHQRGQTLWLRVAPYGTGQDNDVPDWYRALVGEEKGLPEEKWRTDPENPLYFQHFGNFVRDFGTRYDGHPGLESVDLSIVGAWGEGAGSELLTPITRERLVNAYLESFRRTPLVMLLTDPETNRYGLSKRTVGWRADCLGDMGGFSPTWSHMNDYYPQAIIKCGFQDAWKKAPVSLEVCWVMQHWKDMGWDIDYIIDQSLKWHISSFNGKSSAVPEEWWPQVNRWLKSMGYRFVLRKFTYPSMIQPGGTMAFTSWWENQGVAPCYRYYRLAFRLKNDQTTSILYTESDIRSWLPGDNLCDATIAVPADLPEGEYELALGLLDELSENPKIQLAIAGRDATGWYSMGRIEVRR